MFCDMSLFFIEPVDPTDNNLRSSSSRGGGGGVCSCPASLRRAASCMNQHRPLALDGGAKRNTTRLVPTQQQHHLVADSVSFVTKIRRVVGFFWHKRIHSGT